MKHLRELYEVPRPRTAIVLDPKLLETYVGKYDLLPSATLTVRREGSKLMVRASGDTEDVEVFAETETKFFYKGEDLWIEFFKDAAGIVNRLILHDDGREYPGPRIEQETDKKP